MNATLGFLETILPPEGDHWYVAVFIRNDRTNQRWFITRLELASALVSEDASGTTAYYAVGVYRERS